MVPAETLRKHLPSGTALFPAYRALPERTRFITVDFENPAKHPRSAKGPLDWFKITTPLHTSFEAEWPIPVDTPLAIRGFRNALDLSQVKFAAALGQGRLNIERWEAGSSRPFRGHSLSLLDLLRPLAHDPLAAGQLLNLAAAVACPKLTRPTAIYTGHEIAHPLTEKRLDHADLTPALLEALVSSEILVPLDFGDDSLDARYIPLVGIGGIDRQTEPWEPELRAVARQLQPGDRDIWLTLGKRLARS